MAAGPAVTAPIGKNEIERGAISAAAGASRAGLTRKENSLLRTALLIALLAAVISIIARLAPQWPVAAPIIATTIFFAGIGGIGIIAMTGALRSASATRAATLHMPVSIAAAMESLPFGIALWDRHHRLIQANTTYTELLELAPPGIIIGSPRSQIAAIGERALDDILSAEQIQSRHGICQVERTAATNGGIIEIIRPIGAQGAGIDANSEISREITERNRHLIGEISRLSILNDGLQGEIGELETKLASAQNQVQATAAEKTEFLSHMSHELRTPLNAILGFSDMMRSGIFGPLGHEKYDEYAIDIHTSGEQLLNMITDILDVSQIQSGEVPIERQNIQLQDTVTNCLAMLRPRIFASGIALTELIDGLPTVYADPIAVRQILLHIISNAMKFTPTGGRICIKADVQEKVVTLIIDDTGIGISPQIMETIDQPFAALGQDAMITGDEATGLGVGLSVSRALARLNGGALSIESEEGFGTTVRITLPRH